MKKRTEENRKLQRTGKSTFIISLPKGWVEEMGLERGDDVTILRQGDSTLLVFPKEAREEGSEEISMKVLPSDNPGSLIRKVVSLYLSGHRIIHLESKEDRIPPALSDAIRRFVRRNLIGVEITADFPDRLTLQILLAHPELPVKKAIQRMYLIASSMIEDSLCALEEFDRELAEDVIRRDDEVDRFGIYVMRELNSASANRQLIREIGLSAPSDCLGHMHITKSVERIADHAERIARKILELEDPAKGKHVEKMREMGDLARSMFEDANRALFEEDPELADEVLEKKIAMEPAEEQTTQLLIRSEDSKGASKLRMMVDSFQRIAAYSGDIAEVVLDMMIPPEIKQSPS